MKDKKWTRAGRRLKSENPNLFTGGRGADAHRFKGGAHRLDTDYRRSNRKREERDARNGRYED